MPLSLVLYPHMSFICFSTKLNWTRKIKNQNMSKLRLKLIKGHIINYKMSLNYKIFKMYLNNSKTDLPLFWSTKTIE